MGMSLLLLMLRLLVGTGNSSETKSLLFFLNIFSEVYFSP